jgi:uncharacterized membrane protein
MLESWVKPVALEVSVAAEAVAVLIIVFAVAEALWGLTRDGLQHLHRHPDVAHTAKEDVRLRFGRWLALSLEFLLAADILRTAVAPSWQEIGQLAAIAAIRTGINFFLQRDIENATKRRKETPGSPSS